MTTPRFAKPLPKTDLADQAPAMGAGHDPDAKPTRGYNVRLNEWELEQAKKLALRDGRSLQSWLRRAVRNACESGTDAAPNLRRSGAELVAKPHRTGTE